MKKKRLERPTRIAKMRKDMGDDEYCPPMPDVDTEVVYLVTYLWEIGPVLHTGMGPVPLPHQEIRAWQVNTGIELQPWEARCLRELSKDYLVQESKGRDPDEPAPWTAPDTWQHKKATERLVKNIFRS